MSRLGGLGGFAGVRMTSNAMQAARMTGFVDIVVRDHCDDKIEESAAKLVSLMQTMIVDKKCGLAENTELTQKIKGGNIPLVDSSQLVKGITWQRLEAGEAKLPKDMTNTFSACFVGVQRQAGVRGPAHQIGTYKSVNLYNVARAQVTGYTVVLPNNGVKKVVPKRDFRKKPYEKFKDEFAEDMKTGASQAFHKFAVGSL